MRSSISQTIDQGIGTTFDAHVMAGYRFLMRYYDTVGNTTNYPSISRITITDTSIVTDVQTSQRATRSTCLDSAVAPLLQSSWHA